MRRFLIFLCGVAVVGVAAFFAAVAYFLNAQTLLGAAQAYLSEHYARTLTVGSISTQFFPSIGLQATNVKVSYPSGNKTQAAVGRLVASVSLSELLHGDIRIEAVDVDGFSAILRPSDLDALSGGKGPAGGTQPEQSEKTQGALPDMRFKEISIKNASLVLVDEKGRESLKIYDVSLETGDEEDGAVPVKAAFSCRKDTLDIKSTISARLTYDFTVPKASLKGVAFQIDENSLPALLKGNIGTLRFNKGDFAIENIRANLNVKGFLGDVSVNSAEVLAKTWKTGQIKAELHKDSEFGVNFKTTLSGNVSSFTVGRSGFSGAFKNLKTQAGIPFSGSLQLANNNAQVSNLRLLFKSGSNVSSATYGVSTGALSAKSSFKGVSFREISDLVVRQNILDGAVTGSASVAGPYAGDLKSLKGQFAVNVANGYLKGVSADKIASAIRHKNFTELMFTKDDRTEFDQLNASGRLEKAHVLVQKFTAAHKKASMTGKADIDLEKSTVIADLNNKAVLSESKNRAIDIPVHVSGTLESPSATVDLASAAVLYLQNDDRVTKAIDKALGGKTSKKIKEIGDILRSFK